MRKESIILVVWYFCILLTSCCKDKCQDPTNPECSNYDPCFENSFSADFQMYQEFDYKASSELIANWWLKDTIYRSEFLDGDIVPYYYYDRYVFIAKNSKAKSYQWKIGADPRQRTESSFSIGFSGNEGTLTVSLIVEFDPNDPCNKLKKKFDTVSKQFTVVDELTKLPYIGNKYKIKNTATKEERIVEFYKEFYKCNVNGTEGFYPPTIVNIVDTFIFHSNGFNTSHFCAREVYFMAPNKCFFPITYTEKIYDNQSTKGKFILKKDSLICEYRQINHKIENGNITNRKLSPLTYWAGLKF